MGLIERFDFGEEFEALHRQNYRWWTVSLYRLGPELKVGPVSFAFWHFIGQRRNVEVWVLGRYRVFKAGPAFRSVSR